MEVDLAKVLRVGEMAERGGHAGERDDLGLHGGLGRHGEAGLAVVVAGGGGRRRERAVRRRRRWEGRASVQWLGDEGKKRACGGSTGLYIPAWLSLPRVEFLNMYFQLFLPFLKSARTRFRLT